MTAGNGNGYLEVRRRGLMLVLSSPSGAGKTTLSRMLLERDGGLEMSVSVTTRPKRPGEVSGVDYHFIEPDEFNLKVNRRDLLVRADFDSPARAALADYDTLRLGFVEPPGWELLVEGPGRPVEST